MATVDSGSQKIGWKYSTPLQADYLNTFLAGLSSPGLLTRPRFITAPTSSGCDVTICPFSLLVIPTDRESSETDDHGEGIVQNLVKITTTTNVLLSISKATVAIGLTYSFQNGEVKQAQWYADIFAIPQDKLADFKGIIIATCQTYTGANNVVNYSVSTSGADISDALLMSEGWNPQMWLSVVHPKRSNLNYPEDYGYYNRLEVRRHNERYTGYMSGNAGLVRHTSDNMVYQFDYNVDPYTNPNGERGFMQYNYNAFKLQSSGFSLAEGSNTMPIPKVSGGVFALVDASGVNLPEQGTGNDTVSFVNKLKIHPVQQEDINIYYDDTNETLVIN